MAEFEKRHIDALRSFGVNVWLRYVDDIFATVSSKKEAEDVLEFINKKQPNLRFTIEHENDNRLAFLDTSVIRKIGNQRL